MASPPKAPAADPIDARLVRRLADILTETGLSEIEVEHSGLKIRVAKTLTAAPMQMMQAAPMAAALETSRACMIEMPALLPKLRIKVKRPAPSARRFAGRVAKAWTMPAKNASAVR